MFIKVTDLHGKALTVGVRHIMVIIPANNGCTISLVDGRELRVVTTIDNVNNQLERPA